MEISVDAVIQHIEMKESKTQALFLLVVQDLPWRPHTAQIITVVATLGAPHPSAPPRPFSLHGLLSALNPYSTETI